MFEAARIEQDLMAFRMNFLRFSLTSFSLPHRLRTRHTMRRVPVRGRPTMQTATSRLRPRRIKRKISVRGAQTAHARLARKYRLHPMFTDAMRRYAIFTV